MTFYHCAKRILDILVAAGLLVATLPLLLLTAVALWLTEGSPVIFRQQRIGRYERPFTLFKFRTMREGSPPHLPDRPVGKHHDDPRITPFGGILRRSRIDELPQLWNVLRGDMSLVGPRPLPEEDLHRREWLTEVSDEERARRQEWHVRRHQVLPGLSGAWQITNNAEEDFDNWIHADLHYVEHRSFWYDVLIIIRTPFALLRGRQKRKGKK